MLQKKYATTQGKCQVARYFKSFLTQQFWGCRWSAAMSTNVRSLLVLWLATHSNVGRRKGVSVHFSIESVTLMTSYFFPFPFKANPMTFWTNPGKVRTRQFLGLSSVAMDSCSLKRGNFPEPLANHRSQCWTKVILGDWTCRFCRLHQPP